jgi:hypothetical protein
MYVKEDVGMAVCVIDLGQIGFLLQNTSQQKVATFMA